MALRVKIIENIDPQVSRVTMEGVPVSAEKELSASEILKIYRRRCDLESELTVGRILSA
jgi:hypothetical protein